MKRALGHLASKRFQPNVILDIGAGKGWWSVVCSHFFTGADYYLIDPLTENEPHLRSLSKKNSRFHYVLTALGATSGTHVMNVTPECEGSSLLSWDGEDLSRQRMVPVTTADHLLSEGAIRAPDLIKIDVQGYELEVFRGGEEVLRTAEVILAEVNIFPFSHGCPRAHEVIAYLVERGFLLFDIADTLRRPYENDLGQVDLVFASATSPLMSSNRWA